MKATVLALAVLLTACQKEDMQVRYRATCDRCFVEYQATNEALARVDIEGSWNVFIADSIVTDTVVYILDSTRVWGTWSMDVSLEHNARPVLTARNAGNSTYAAIECSYGGERKEASTTVGGETVSAH